MPIVTQRMIYADDIRRNPHVLYLFGDNDKRTGTGGQAKEARGHPNSVGVRTKRRPAEDDGAYWTDEDFLANVAKIDKDLERVERHLRANGIVVIPQDGIGTGKARLPEKAPNTAHYLSVKLASLRTI